MPLHNTRNLTLISVLAMFSLMGCATASIPQSNLTLPAFPNSTAVGEGLYVLPAEKTLIPKTTTNSLEEYGKCVIDFNALRANKGLLGEATRTIVKENDELGEIWEEHRNPPAKPKKRFGLF